MSSFIAGFYVDSPFFISIASFAKRLDWCAWPDFNSYYEQLNALDAPIRFAVDEGDQPYELQIAMSRVVPTRYANWHDYFNALCWCAFPRIKMVFNEQHQQHWSNHKRTRARDGLTLLDESGVIACSDDRETLKHIETMDWPTLFVTQREHTMRHLRVLIIGHGLMEKCLQPYIGMTAHARLLLLSPEQMQLDDEALRQQCDAMVCEQLRASGQLSPTELFPLPLLGIPQWWSANNDAAFYANTHYFRRTRRNLRSSAGE